MALPNLAIIKAIMSFKRNNQLNRFIKTKRD